MIKFIISHFNIKSVDELCQWYDRLSVLKYRGLVAVDSVETADNIRISSIPRSGDENYILICSYNLNAFKQHCAKYRNYQNWLLHRNEERFRINANHGKNYDSKNMYCMCRNMLIAKELAETGVFRLRRDEDREFLLSVKNGEREYDELLAFSEKLNAELQESIKTSTLRETVDVDFINSFLIDLRKRQSQHLL